MIGWNIDSATGGIVKWHECRQGKDPDRGGHVPADLDGGGEQATDQSHLQGPSSVVLPSPTGPQSAWPASRALLSVWRRQRERIGADRIAGELALRRLRETAPRRTVERCLEDGANHSRPATCVVDADIDAEDQPERDPQKGH